jgi:hypothetical protein
VILTGPSPLAFGKESPDWTMTSHWPSAHAESLRPSAAVNGAFAVGDGVAGGADFVGAADAVVRVGVAGVESGALLPVPQPTASKAVGNAMSVVHLAIRNR